MFLYYEKPLNLLALLHKQMRLISCKYRAEHHAVQQYRLESAHQQNMPQS